MGEKPTSADEGQERHDASMSSIGNIRAREAGGAGGGSPAERGPVRLDPTPARAPGGDDPASAGAGDVTPGAAESPGAPLKGVDVKLG